MSESVFTPGPEDRAFRAEVRTFLERHLPAPLRDKVRDGRHVERDELAEWQRTLASQGWLVPHWPREHGGTGWSPLRRWIFEEEYHRAYCPPVHLFGFKMLGPILIRHGTEAQQRRYLPPLLASQDWWCQGYSEPEAGSDLASLRTRAVREGDVYVVNGSKIWTSLAHWANRIFCLVRTDVDAKPQRGISFLLIDMQAPGVRIVPIVSIDGRHHFNQVFFDDVRVPVSNRVGDENEGWTIAKSLLGFERLNASRFGEAQARLRRLVEIASVERNAGAPLVRHDGFRRHIAEAAIQVIALRYAALRCLARMSVGEPPGPQASMLKLRGSEIGQVLHDLLLRAVGLDGLPFAREGEPDRVDRLEPDYASAMAPQKLFGRGATIAAGSSEVQHEILARELAEAGIADATDWFEPARRPLAESVRRFLAAAHGASLGREVGACAEGCPPSVWRSVAQLGWLGIGTPETLVGGCGGDPLDILVVMEGLGHAQCALPIVSSVVAGGRLLRSLGSADQIERVLVPMIAGRHRIALAASEPQARFDLHDVRTRAWPDGDGHRLTGCKNLVLDAAASDTLIVVARTDGEQRSPTGLSLFLVPRDHPGVRVRGYSTYDGRAAADLILEDVALEASALLGPPGGVWPALEDAVDAAIAALCAEAVGAMRLACELTGAHLATRRQFGRTLGTLQVLRHRLVDMHVALEEARSLALAATLCLDGPPTERRRMVAAAKSRIGRLGRRVGHEAVQLHGATGMADESRIGQCLRQLLAIDTLFGDADHHLDRFTLEGLDG
jgi:alkylation response protein AidB-like acyl-CoA dehydrogenase